LIPMGVLDPLNDAKDRAIRFGALRKGISIDELQAGHWYVNSSPRYEQRHIKRPLPYSLLRPVSPCVFCIVHSHQPTR
jgi:hypothetical protein